jgi:hypothetical protein
MRMARSSSPVRCGPGRCRNSSQALAHLRRGSDKKIMSFALITEKLDWRKSRGNYIFNVGEKRDWDKTGQEIERVKRELSGGKLSRRLLLNHLRGLGIGFGAAFLLGVKPSGATGAVEGAATLRSTNPALNKIIEKHRRVPGSTRSRRPKDPRSNRWQRISGWGTRRIAGWGTRSSARGATSQPHGRRSFARLLQRDNHFWHGSSLSQMPCGRRPHHHTNLFISGPVQGGETAITCWM